MLPLLRTFLPWSLLELSEREQAKSRNKGNGIATGESQRPCLDALRSSDGCPCLGCFWNSQRERAKSRNRGNGTTTRESATPLPWWVAFPPMVAVVCSVMSVAPIGATLLPWLLPELTEGTESQQGNGITTALPCRFSLLKAIAKGLPERLPLL